VEPAKPVERERAVPPTAAPMVAAPLPAFDVTGERLLFLAPDVAMRNTRRAILVRAGELRLTPGGPVVAVGHGPLADEFDVLVVEEGERPGLVLGDGLRMFAVIDLADLAEVVSRRVRVTDAPTAIPPADDTGVFLEIGTWPEISERIDGWVRVSGGCDPILYEGWIPADAIARVFDEQPEGEGMVEATVAAGSRIFVSPGGPVLASFPGPEGHVASYPVELIGAAKRGFRKIEFGAPTCIVRGWVPTRKIDLDGPIEELWGGAVTSTHLCDGSSETEFVAEGTLLTHAVSGVVFAALNGGLRLSRLPGDADGRLCVATPWGPLEVRAAPR